MNAADREMTEMFVYETEGMLRKLDDSIERNENADVFSAEDTNELFRIMHTIKGSAAMLQLTPLSESAHRLEDLFSLIRSGCAKTGAGSMKTICAALLTAMRYFQNSTEALSRGEEQPQPPAELGARVAAAIAAVSSGPVTGPASDQGGAVAAPAAAAPPAWTKNAFKAKIMLKPSPLPSARAIVVLRSAARLCGNICSLPEDLEKHPELAAEITKNGFTAAFTPNGGVGAEQVVSLIKKNIHVASCELLARQEEKADKIISVSQSKLAGHLDLIEELLTAESMLEARFRGASVKDTETGGLLLRLRECSMALHRSAESMNLVSVESLFYRLRMIVREMCASLHKDAVLACSGGSVEVDRNMLDQLYDPLMHMVRNAVDHGVESAERRAAAGKPERGLVKVDVSKLHEDYIRVVVSDDGAGIDTDKVYARASAMGIVKGERGAMTDSDVYALLLRPGFTMSERVSAYSGRGVGLDVVNMRVKKLGGALSVSSEPGKGSSFVMTLPSQLSVAETLEIWAGGRRMLIPLGSVAAVMDYSEFASDASVQDGAKFLNNGVQYDYVDLSGILGSVSEVGRVVLCEGEKPAAVRVDDVHSLRTVSIKPLPDIMRRMKLLNDLYAGCSVMQDGRVSMVLNTDKLFLISGKEGA